MDSNLKTNPLFFILPVVAIIAGIAFLFSPSLFSGSSESQDIGSSTRVYSYYNEVLTEEELQKLSAEKSVFTVTYDQPVNGKIGSVWNSEAEAKAEESKQQNNQSGSASSQRGSSGSAPNGGGSPQKPVPGNFDGDTGSGETSSLTN